MSTRLHSIHICASANAEAVHTVVTITITTMRRAIASHSLALMDAPPPPPHMQYVRAALIALVSWILYYCWWGTREQVTRAIKIVYYLLQMVDNAIQLFA